MSQSQQSQPSVVKSQGVDIEALEGAEKPKKRAVRRKKQDEDKELFPFYEQSLF
jgi:hypothetical protein